MDGLRCRAGLRHRFSYAYREPSKRTPRGLACEKSVRSRAGEQNLDEFALPPRAGFGENPFQMGCGGIAGDLLLLCVLLQAESAN